MLRYYFFACIFLCSLSVKSQPISCKSGVVSNCLQQISKPISEKYPYPTVDGVINLEVAIVDLQYNGSAFPTNISSSNLKNHLSTLYGAQGINLNFTDVSYTLQDGIDDKQMDCFLDNYNDDVGDGKIHLLFGLNNSANSFFNSGESIAAGAPATKAIVEINSLTTQEEANFLAAHELGHCLGLFHTFQSNQSPTRAAGVEVSCSEVDDQICDIKPSVRLDAGQLQFNASTGLCEILAGSGLINTDYTFEATHNVMNYFDDFRCAQAFSEEQASKMRYIILEDPDLKACVSNLNSFPAFADILDYMVIDQPTTWNTPKLVAGIIIKQGASLTIQNTTVSIYPSYNKPFNGYDNSIPVFTSGENDCTQQNGLCGKIVIERGGKLEAHNTTFKPAEIYRPYRWNGFYVEGNYNSPQTSSNQGLLKLYDCTIQGAHTAVQTRGGKFSNDGDFLFHGGIVEASNTSFINNWRDVELLSYRNMHNGTELPNECDFRNCTFQKDNDYSITYEYGTSGIGSNQSAYCAISMWGVKGVKVRGCTFNNSYNIQQQEIPGILAIAASPKVKNFSSFSGWSNAIEVRNYCSNIYNVEVFDSDFQNNRIGVYLSATTNSKIIDNQFDVSKDLAVTGSLEEIPVGLYLQESLGFTVEENEFRTLGINGDAIGAVVYSSGPYSNEISRNLFDGFWNQNHNNVGAAAYGVNRTEPTSQNNFTTEGLVFSCNNFGQSNENDVDLFVRAGELANNQDGINDLQGEQSDGANNLFSVSSNGGPNIINATNNSIDYFYNNGDTRFEPAAIIGGKVNVVPTNLFGSYANDCNITFSDVSQPNIATIQTDLSTINSDITSGKSNFMSLIDNGSTPMLESEILFTGAEEYQELYLDLMATAPYVSVENLLNVISLDNFPELALRNIMIANPHSSRSSEVMQALYERQPPLSQQTLDDIENEEQTITTKDVLEGQLNTLTVKRHILLRALTHKFGEDTLGANKSAILNMYSNQTDLSSRLTYSLQLHSDGNNFLAKQVIDSTQNTMQLSEVESQELSSLSAYYNLLSTTGTTLDDLDSLTLSSLDSLANVNNGLAGNLASGVLLLNGWSTSTATPRYLPILNQAKANPHLKNNRLQKNEVEINIFPNPAKKVLFVQWDWFKNGIEGSIKFRLINQLGQCNKIIELKDYQKNSFRIDLESYPPGVYHLEIQSQGKILDVKQVVKI